MSLYEFRNCLQESFTSPCAQSVTVTGAAMEVPVQRTRQTEEDEDRLMGYMLVQ